ncbi:MAG TPA: DUF1552 domain-containing protein [Polyangiaceae bacterium]|nr:DUF1552 domain-containing protein [Polyangiaceae bacterium]
MSRASWFSRRAFLGGSAVCVALPLFESLRPRLARGQAMSVPKRFVGYFVPSGQKMDDWTPAGTGSNWQPAGILEPLAPYKASTTVLTGLQNTHQEDNLGAHAGGTGAFLTGRTVPRYKTVMGGPSIDQVIAAAIGQQTSLPSLQLGGEPGSPAGTCDSGYPCAFANQISFTERGVPMPKFSNVNDAFTRLIAGTDTTLSASEVARRAALQISALDVVKEEAADIDGRLSAYERPKFEQYLDSVREVERRIQVAASAPLCNATRPANPVGDAELVQTMSDLMVLAFQCDLTRVISFQWGNAASNRIYGFLDPSIVDGHHNISHHQSLPGKLAQLKTIDTWQITQLAYLAQKLSVVQEADGESLLFHSLIFYSSDVSDGDLHNHDDMPVLLLGQAGGAIRSGRHVAYDHAPWFANLFITIANALDVPITEFGENGDAPLTI